VVEGGLDNSFRLWRRQRESCTMRKDYKFIAYGAIVALVFMTITSGLDDLTRLVIVASLCATALAIEKLL
jgi:hypothetical protein